MRLETTMNILPLSTFLSRPFTQWVLLGAVVLAGFVDQFRLVSFGPVSGLAVLTLAECAVVWGCCFIEPRVPARNGTVASMLLFTIWAWGTLLWASAPLEAMQTLVVFALFLGLLLLGFAAGSCDRGLPYRLGVALDVMSGIATVVCLVQTCFGAGEVDEATNVRGGALVMLVGLCYQLAAWHHGRRSRLLVAVAMVAVIIISRSRTASAVAIVLFPVAAIVSAKRNHRLLAAIQALVVGGGLAAGLFLYKPMAERMLGSRSLSDVSSEGVNSSGRAEMWDEIFESFQRHIWLGQGVGSTSSYTDRPGMYHPHNDYLMLAHDYGLLGLGLFLLGLGLGVARLGHHLKPSADRPARPEPGDTICLTALLATITLLLAMTTNNLLTYAFVMAPTAVLLGVGLGRSEHPRHREPQRGDPLWGGGRVPARRSELRHAWPD